MSQSASRHIAPDPILRFGFDTISFLYLSLPIVVVWQWIGSLFLAALLVDQVDHYALAVWLLISTVLLLYRHYHAYLFRKTDSQILLDHLAIWSHRYISDVLLGGVLWGSSALLIFPHSSDQSQIVMVLFVFMVAFITMTTIAAKFELLLIYCLITFVPLITQLLTSSHEAMGLIVIALMVVLVLVSKFFGSILLKSIRDHRSFLDIQHSFEVLQERFFSLFERAPVGIVYYNETLTIQDCNQKFLEMNDISSKSRVINTPLGYECSDELQHCFQQVFANHTASYRGAYTPHNSRIERIVDLSTVPLLTAQQEVIGGIAIIKDITDEVSAKERVMRNAYYDMLTNIPNRTLLMDHLNQALVNARSEHHFGSILYLDLDNFKRINELYGHEKGDHILKQVVGRIAGHLDNGTVLARIGGDKFAVLLPNLPEDGDEALRVSMHTAEQIKNSFLSALFLGTDELYLTLSIGLALFPGLHEENAFDLLKSAEIAMYASKKGGKNSITLFQQNMSSHVREFLSIDRGLRKAISNRELMMFYQPQIDVQSGRIVSAEALIRWNHPTQGFISPALFIPVAEESGFITELSYWVIQRVLEDIHSIIHERGTFALDYFAININSAHFLSPNFEDEVKSSVEYFRIPAEKVELEITEGVVMHNIDEAIAKMRTLQEYGFKISMDDFGTGYSSLSYLSKLPFNSLKIDQSFIRTIDAHEQNQKLVATIIDLAKNFNMHVVAEGVESKAALELLKAHECELYQGYYAYKPMPIEELKKLF